MSVSELKYPKNRLRRTRQAKWIRNLTQESMLSSNDLVWPVFVCEGNNIKDEIQSMPNVYRYSIDNLNEVYDIASEHKINLIAVFPFTPQELKTKYGDEALNCAWCIDSIIIPYSDLLSAQSPIAKIFFKLVS